MIWIAAALSIGSFLCGLAVLFNLTFGAWLRDYCDNGGDW